MRINHNAPSAAKQAEYSFWVLSPDCRGYRVRIQDVHFFQTVKSPSFILPRVAGEERGGGEPLAGVDAHSGAFVT
jgi:hypothetical protein